MLGEAQAIKLKVTAPAASRTPAGMRKIRGVRLLVILFRSTVAHPPYRINIVSPPPVAGGFCVAVPPPLAPPAAAPEAAGPAPARRVIEGFGLTQNPLTTQIESHDGMAELFDALQRWNTVLLDLDRDVWLYVSMRYLRQKAVPGEVGSSTMPHKINPIDFENSEGNLGPPTAPPAPPARKPPIPRMHRPPTDPTATRTTGAGFAYPLTAAQSPRRGLGRMSPAPEALAADLDANWEVLAEPIQTVMRRYGVPNAYEKLKALTRGQAITRADLQAFVQGLDIPQAAKERLLALTPAAYVGLARTL